MWVFELSHPGVVGLIADQLRDALLALPICGRYCEHRTKQSEYTQAKAPHAPQPPI
jgi:hypothetical protein